MKHKVEISSDLLFEIATLVYHRWSIEYDLLKLVKAERPDGSPDWHLFHTARLKHHTASEDSWRKRKDEITAVFATSNLRELSTE